MFYRMVHHYPAPVTRGMSIVMRVALCGCVWVLLSMIVAPFVVEGHSMTPTLHNGQWVFVDRLAYQHRSPQRADLVVFRAPDDATQQYLKRIIGLPGDTVELRDRQLYINGVLVNEPYLHDVCQHRCPDSLWQVEPDAYFVMGDNRDHSRDSRAFGTIPRTAVLGQAILRYHPLVNFAWINS